MSVRAGMSRTKALEGLTIANAKILGLEDRIGSLEPGKDADFVVLTGDPLSVYTHVEQTWIDGKKVFDLRDPVQRNYATGGYGYSRDERTEIDEDDGDAGGDPVRPATRTGSVTGPARPRAALALACGYARGRAGRRARGDGVHDGRCPDPERCRPGRGPRREDRAGRARRQHVDPQGISGSDREGRHAGLDRRAHGGRAGRKPQRARSTRISWKSRIPSSPTSARWTPTIRASCWSAGSGTTASPRSTPATDRARW